MADNPVIVKRITSSTLIGGKAEIQRIALSVENGQSVDLYNVFGRAYDIQSGATQYGPWVALLGTFEAINLMTGEVVNATKLFVPDVLANLVAAALKPGAGMQNMDLAYCVIVKRDDKAATGYVYHARPLLPPDETDPLEEMRRRLIALPGMAEKLGARALPAPAAADDGKKTKK